MNSRILLNLGMLLAVVVLIWLTYASIQELPETERPRLSNLQSENVSQLRLERGEEVLLFERRENSLWFMTQPVEVAAMPILISRMLAHFTLQSQERYPAIGLDLRKYGLDKPRVVLVADQFSLAFGRINPLNGLRYVRTESELHMVAENDISFLQQGWPTFVSRTLIPENRQVEGLQIEGFGGLLRSEGGWLYQGAAAPESADQMQLLVDRWQIAQALTVSHLEESVNTGFFGVKVVVDLKDAGSIEFIVNKQADDWLLYRADVGLVYKMIDMEPLLQWPSLSEGE